MYLGAKLFKTRLDNPVKYVHEAVRTCKDYLAANISGRFRIPERAGNPFKMGYDPELDISPELGPDNASYFKTITSILR